MGMTHTMTEAEAINEAVLLLTRKMRRLHAAEFNHVWELLPDGAKDAIYLAERLADQVRDANPQGALYPQSEEIDETE